MNSPSTRSAPSPPCMRPNSTVPKTTSLAARQPRQHLRPRQVAQARRAHPQRPRPRAQPLRQSRRPPAAAPRRSRVPSPCTSSSPNGAVGSSTSPSISRKNASCSSAAHPQPRLRHEVAERQRRRQLDSRAQQVRRDLLLQHLQRRVVARQVVRAAAAAASGRCARPRRCTPRSSGARRRSMPVLPRVEARATAARPRPRRRVQLHLLDRQRRLPPHHLHRLAQPLPTPPCAGCRAARSPPAAPPGTRSSRARRVEAQSALDSRYGSPSCASRWWKRIPSCSGASG